MSQRFALQSLTSLCEQALNVQGERGSHTEAVQRVSAGDEVMVRCQELVEGECSRSLMNRKEQEYIYWSTELVVLFNGIVQLSLSQEDHVELSV